MWTLLPAAAARDSQQEEDNLVANALTVLVLGTRPSFFAPWQV